MTAKLHKLHQEADQLTLEIETKRGILQELNKTTDKVAADTERQEMVDRIDTLQHENTHLV
jgi:hypothetical protein